MVREHTGFGWGDPIDPTKQEIWLSHGYVCVYDPQHPGRVELWTAYGIVDSRYASTNAGRAKEYDAICKARNYGRTSKNYRPWYADNYPHGDWEMHSRFD